MNSREFLFPSVCKKKGFSSFNFALIKKAKIPQRKSAGAKAFDANGFLFIHLFRFSVATVSIYLAQGCLSELELNRGIGSRM